MADAHELELFMDQVAAEMGAEYERIRRRSREDPGTAGDEGESNWRSLFQDWLPPALQVVTKGRILGADGQISPQVDLIILSPSYPAKLLDKKVYLAGGVLAAFECKLTLRRGHLEKCAKTASIIREVALEGRHDSPTPFRELYSPIMYGVLAHDADFGSDTYERLNATIAESLGWCQHPADLIDVFCVATLNSWERMSVLFLPPPALSVSLWEPLAKRNNIPPEGGIHTQYSSWRYYGATPQGAAIHTMIGYVLERLARRLPDFRDFARYWELARTDKRVGEAEASRLWPLSVLTENLQSKLKERGRDIVANSDFWAEWRMGF